MEIVDIFSFLLIFQLRQLKWPTFKVESQETLTNIKYFNSHTINLYIPLAIATDPLYACMSNKHTIDQPRSKSNTYTHIVLRNAAPLLYGPAISTRWCSILFLSKNTNNTAGPDGQARPQAPLSHQLIICRRPAFDSKPPPPPRSQTAHERWSPRSR